MVFLFFLSFERFLLSILIVTSSTSGIASAQSVIGSASEAIYPTQLPINVSLTSVIGDNPVIASASEAIYEGQCPPKRY